MSGKAGNVDDGLEDIGWIRGPGVGGREVARGVQRSSPKPEKGLFFAIGEGSRNFVACFLHSSTKLFLYQTPGRRPPPITGRFVNTVTRGWVGATNERAPFKFHGADVVFFCRSMSVQDSESRRFEQTFG